MNDNENVIPEAEVDVPALEGVLKEFPSLRTRAPMLKWSDKYKAWSPEDKIAYLEKLASSLNEALRSMQTDRNRLSEIAFKQDEQLKQGVQRLTVQNELVQTQVGTWNADKEERLQRIVALQGKVREQAQRIKALETELAMTVWQKIVRWWNRRVPGRKG